MAEMDGMEGEIAEAAKRVLARLKGALSRLAEPVGDGIDYEEKAREDVEKCCGLKLNEDDAEEDLKERAALFGLAMNKLWTGKDKAEKKKMKDFAKDDKLTETLEGIFISILEIEADMELKDYYTRSLQTAVKTTISEYTQRLRFKEDAALKRGEVQDVSRILDRHDREVGAGTVTPEALLCTAYRLGNAELHREAAAAEQAGEAAESSADGGGSEASSSTVAQGAQNKRRQTNGNAPEAKKQKGPTDHDEDTKRRINEADSYLRSRKILTEERIQEFTKELNGLTDAPFILEALYSMGWCNSDELGPDQVCEYNQAYKVTSKLDKDNKAPVWVFNTDAVFNNIEKWSNDSISWFWLLCIVLSRDKDNLGVLENICAQTSKGGGAYFQRGRNMIKGTLETGKKWNHRFHKLALRFEKGNGEFVQPIAHPGSPGRELLRSSLTPANQVHHTVNLIMLDCLCMLQKQGYQSLWRRSLWITDTGRKQQENGRHVRQEVSITTAHVEESLNNMSLALGDAGDDYPMTEPGELVWSNGTFFKARNKNLARSTRAWKKDFKGLIEWQEHIDPKAPVDQNAGAAQGQEDHAEDT